MPQYTYINDETGEKIDLFQGMNDEHKYIDENGKEWRRIFYSPNASVDSLSDVDPFDTRKLVEKTGKMKGTIGDLWTASEEASKRREDKLGHEDPVRRKYLDNYQKENNRKHFHDRPQKIDAGVATIDFSKLKSDQT